MARIRTIKPEFFTSEKVAQLTDPAKITFIGLWTEADDYGVLQDNAKILKGHLWPLDDTKTAVDLSLHVQELIDLDLVRRFEADGNRWLHISGFTDNQTINRPSKKRNPSPPWGCSEPSRDTHGALTEESVRVEPGTLRSHRMTLSEPSVSPHGALTVGSGSGKGSGKGSGGGSGSPPDPDRMPNPIAAISNGTTTTTPIQTQTSFGYVRAHLARQYARPGEEAAYASRIKPEDHAPELERLHRERPELDPDEIAALYLAGRAKPAPQKPRCGICKGDPHPNGPIDCPALGA